MLNGNLISHEIRANYGRDPRIPHPGEVAVSERAGAVTLRGTVGTPQPGAKSVEPWKRNLGSFVPPAGRADIL